MFVKIWLCKILNLFGLRLCKIQGYQCIEEKFSGNYNLYNSAINLNSGNIIDLERLSDIGLSIPGMLSKESGKILYTLCYLQNIQGDVVEIGSWQGRSTSFLARAVENSGNGNFYAIDHYKANKGKEHHYFVDQPDSSGLENKFNMNMKNLGLSMYVNLLNMPSKDAATKLTDIKIRLLFIDGDHTREGVESDIKLFFSKCLPGSIIVFDDFSESFPGLIEAVDDLMQKHMFARKMSCQNMLVLML